MRQLPQQISLTAWDRRYRRLGQGGLREPTYGGRLGRHLRSGNSRLRCLRFDNSVAALNLWNLLLTEESRLHTARRRGHVIIGTMKDLGTVPVMAYAIQGVTAFYPDGAWWLPCLMGNQVRALDAATATGLDETFCPVRAMVGAFLTRDHFPIPDLLTCNVGAVCDDFSAIAQHLENMGYPILWWEMPHRREPAPRERAVTLAGGMRAPAEQVRIVRAELSRVLRAIEKAVGRRCTDRHLAEGIRQANRIRRILDELRRTVFTAALNPLPALEMQVAEMLAIHYCSDRSEAARVLLVLLREVRSRVRRGVGFGNAEDARLFWINPVADMRAMLYLEEAGGRLCGTEYLFTHALDPIPYDADPLRALARTALADPMVGTSGQRAARIVRDIRQFGSEGVVISRIPGASHCALEGQVLRDIIQEECDLPVVEIEVPSVSDAGHVALTGRLRALVETARERRAYPGNGWRKRCR